MISAIVLAAGKSSRMGENNKLLLPYKNSTIIGTVLDELKNSLVDEIIVVGRPENNIYSLVKNDASYKYVVNENSDDGLTSSIHCGMREAQSQASGYIICHGDMPLLNYNDYNILINKYLDINDKVILLPIKNKKRGNPVLFSSHFKEEILALESSNGCKPIVAKNSFFVSEVVVNNSNYFTDIDTADDYDSIS